MKKSDEKFIEKSSITEKTEGEEEWLDRMMEESNFNTIEIAHAQYEYSIEKIYEIQMLEEQKSRGSNITRGGEVKEMMEIDPKILKILHKSCSEFLLSPEKCQDILTEAKIINYSALHFAKFIYTQPIGLVEKSKYLFDSKDEFAIEVKECFYTLFNLENLSLKDFLLTIHTKVSPPWDSERKADFYDCFWKEYSSQNHHKKTNPENVMFMISSTFFVLTDQKHKNRRGGISLEQYLGYVKEYGDDFITISQAKTYFKEIQEGKFLEDFVKIMISVDGIHKYEDNINFMKNVHKILPQATIGDPFFSNKTRVLKLQLKKRNVTEKKIWLNEKEKKFLWYNKGGISAKSLNFKEIINAEIGFTPTFLQYLEIPKFKELLKNHKLCFSIETKKRSYDFYGRFFIPNNLGINEREVYLWYSRFKVIANENVNKLGNIFPEIEKSLFEPWYDKVKLDIWEREILNNWPSFIDTSNGITPLDSKKLKFEYELETEILDEESKEKIEIRTESMKFSQFLMLGLPCKI